MLAISTMPFQQDLCDKEQDYEHEALKYQNTYRLEAYNTFKADLVEKIIETILSNKLENVSYDAAVCPKLCESVATDIRDRIKKLNFDRCKIVVNMAIIEKASQSVQTSIGFLWDIGRDNYSTFMYEARTFHAYCCVFGLYYE
ncbi:dynein light chain Tctex-type protein 2 [Calliopsis andreniformis]|uniref:dynein light chain Tctex-type protein 2 n=1 Tax=Calliopsis andreniformis TaxID=337506 RepID=UPI003FCD328F